MVTCQESLWLVKAHSNLPPLLVNDTVTTEPCQKALPSQLTSSCSARLKNVLTKLLFQGSFKSPPLPLLTSSLRRSFMLLLLSNSVCSFLEELWPAGVTNHLLKPSAEEVAQPLSDVYNKSLLEGMFPVCWKTATISPVPKEGKHLSLPFILSPYCSPLGRYCP